jgi:dihydrofolate reductase
MMLSLIVAAARNDVIGHDGTLPWHLPEDLRRFRKLTTGCPVVVGRLTHESIVARLGRPLPGRISVVVSTGSPGEESDGVVWTTSVDAALATAAAACAAAGSDAAAGDGGEAFVIGGATIYEQALPRVDRIYLTRLEREVDGDTRMPSGWLDGFTLTARDDRPGAEPGGGFAFLEYRRDPS